MWILEPRTTKVVVVSSTPHLLEFSVRLASLVAAATLLAASLAARAETLNFTFTGVNGVFCQLEGECTPSQLFSLDFDVSTPSSYTSSTTNYTQGNEVLTIYQSGLAIDLDDTAGEDFLGDPLYGYSVGLNANGLTDDVIRVGPTSSPTILTGSYTGGYAYIYDTTEFIDTDTVLTITNVSETPEPSSIALLGTGLLGVVGVLRKRSLQ